MKSIVIDWDGTLVPEAYPDRPAEWLPGAKQAVQKFLDAGYRVRVHSCRTHTLCVDESGPNECRDEEIAYIRGMLNEAGFRSVEIILDDKPGADHYIDNKAIRFNGNWGRIARSVIS